METPDIVVTWEEWKRGREAKRTILRRLGLDTHFQVKRLWTDRLAARRRSNADTLLIIRMPVPDKDDRHFFCSWLQIVAQTCANPWRLGTIARRRGRSRLATVPKIKPFEFPGG